MFTLQEDVNRHFDNENNISNHFQKYSDKLQLFYSPISEKTTGLYICFNLKKIHKKKQFSFFRIFSSKSRHIYFSCKK
ncbi:hypothetical protein DD595_25465, partial [Enterobacter cloacae complex sp. 4DZ3-17B2]